MTMNPTNGRAPSKNPGRDTSQGGMPSSVVDPKGGPPGGRNVLLVGTVEDVASSLTPHIRSGDVVKVVVQAVGQDVFDWLAHDEKAFPHAQAIAQTAAEQIASGPTGARGGEADVRLAIRDALTTFPADEILVAVEGYGWTPADALEVDNPARSGQRTIAGVPVRTVAIAPA